MRNVLGLVLFGLIGLAMLVPAGLQASTSDELKYLGYSDEISQDAMKEFRKTHSVPQGDTSPFGSKREPPYLDDVEAVQEQLTELGRSRSLTSETQDKSLEVKAKLDEYWAKMDVSGKQTETIFLTAEMKEQIKSRLAQVLADSGYTVKQLDLVDMPSNLGNGQVRAIVRVVKPLKTNHGYREIQNNLGEIKQRCIEAGTVDGILYLSELTTFIAENPRNNYYYEKTVLNP